MQAYFCMGRLSRDVELRATNSGKMVCDFGVAVPDGKDKDGSDKVVWVDVTAWDKVAEHVAKWFKKGKPIVIKNARWINDDYEKDGQTVKRMRVVLTEFPFFTLNNKNEDIDPSDDEPEVIVDKPTPKAKAKPAKAKAPQKAKVEEFDTEDEDDEDVPF
jgi:single-strand DNA-binding protein